ncbi:hypothetical protein [Nocardioides sp.]|uniref:hypothetical protein n=1 Tax=Nocardioides sp. TaxID=35761 RepID=UPI002C3CAAF6|nr:hypothetical protein [Nocardioides sp.]HXH79499.1 hypothetical protein [Nocardioides sp.]
MATHKDTAAAHGDDAAETVTISAEEYARLMAAGEVNTTPAIEEGPHLDDPEIRAAKRAQLRDAGIDHEADGLSDDMRTILREKGN